MIEDIFLNFDFWFLGIISLFVIFIYFLIVRKAIYAWFDPLLLYFIFNIASVSLVLYLYKIDAISEYYLVSFSFSVCAFLVGIRVGNRKIKVNINSTVLLEFSKYNLTLDILLLLIVVILLMSNGLLFLIKGTVPLLSSNPSDAKVNLYMGGWGIVRRLNFVFVSIGLSIIFVKLVNPVLRGSKTKRLYLVFSLFSIVFVLLSTGSKSALLKVLSTFFPIYLINVSLSKNLSDVFSIDNIIGYMRKVTIVALLGALGYMFLIFFLSYGSDNILTSLLVRFISAGDTYFFYYVFDLDGYFHHHPIDFITHNLNPLLGMVRLSEYEYPIGSYILSYVYKRPLDSFGPNAQYPIEGLIYFGPYLGCIYAFFVGLIISYVRTGCLRSVLKKPNQLAQVIYAIGSSLIITFATESALFSTQLLDIFFFGVPLFLISLVIKEIINA